MRDGVEEEAPGETGEEDEEDECDEEPEVAGDSPGGGGGGAQHNYLHTCSARKSVSSLESFELSRPII